VAALLLFVKRADGRKELALMVASVLVLLPVTFLFLPLWLRLALDLCLAAGLIWIVREPARTVSRPRAAESRSLA
jgi:hypothetical protein